MRQLRDLCPVHAMEVRTPEDSHSDWLDGE